MSQAAAVTGQFLPSGDIGNKTKSIVLIAVVVLVIAIVIIVIKKGSGFFDSITGGVDSLLEKFGLKEDANDKKANADVAAIDSKANQSNSPFNSQFYKTAPGGTSLFTSARAKQLAEEVYDSVGTFYDDPEAGFGAIKQAKNWAQVSQIADMFNQQYSKDLFSWLKIKYDTTAQKDVLAKLGNYAFALPKY